jgi:TATA-box binding protein (TBP) (component of TFIID and TFIIIB)
MTKKQPMQRYFKVVNVVATMNCGFHINIEKIWELDCCLYTTQGETCSPYTAIKPPKATHQITIFYNGNMITVGNTSEAEAKKNLYIARRFLKAFERKEGT